MAQGRDDLYNEILRNGPSPGTILLVLSELKKDGQLKQAIQECIKALSVHPHDVSIRRLLAETYFEAGLITQAEAELETVTAGIGDLSAAYKLQAEIYSQQRREEEAAKALKIYLVHRPDDQEAHHLLEALEAVEEAPVEPLSSFAVIYERPLRKPLYDPAPVVEAAPPPKPKPKPTFTLIGTVVEPGFTYGMFRTNKGETKLVEIGESIGGAEVTAVTEAGATVLMDGESIEMTVKEKEGL